VERNSRTIGNPFTIDPDHGGCRQMNRVQVGVLRNGLKQALGLRRASVVMGILARRVGVQRRRGIFRAGRVGRSRIGRVMRVTTMIVRTGVMRRVSASRLGGIFLEAVGGFRQVLEQVVNAMRLGSGEKKNEQRDHPQRNDRPASDAAFFRLGAA
jgi:hypothetical protein